MKKEYKVKDKVKDLEDQKMTTKKESTRYKDLSRGLKWLVVACASWAVIWTVWLIVTIVVVMTYRATT